MIRDHGDVLGWGEFQIIPEDVELFEQMLRVGQDAQSVEMAEQFSTELWARAIQNELPKPEVQVSIIHFDTDSDMVTIDNGEQIKANQYVFCIDLDGYTLSLGGQTISFHERLHFSSREALDEFQQRHHFNKIPYSAELRDRVAARGAYRRNMRELFDGLGDEEGAPLPQELESALFDDVQQFPNVPRELQDPLELEGDVPDDQLN